MEPSDILLSSENNKPIGLQGIKRFVSTFYKYLYLTESFPKAVCKFNDNDANTTPTPQSDNMESPYNALCESLRDNSPCLHEPIRELYLYIFGMLQKGLKGDNLSLTEEENNDLADALEALIFIAVSVKTATKLYTCDRHQGQLMGTVDWPAPLIRKLIPYLVQHMDSTARIDRVLLRVLEIIVNPPQPFGTSKAWLTIMREIEEDFILEDSQASKFLSFLFVMLSTEARVRLCGIYQEQVQQLLDADTLPTLSLETLAFINFMSCNTKTQQAWIKSGVHTVLVEWMIECFMAKKDLSEDNGREKIDIVIQIFVNLAQGLGKTALDEVVTLIQNRAVAHYKIYQKNDIFKEVMAPILSAVPFSSFIPVSVNIGAHLIGNSEIKPISEAASLFEESRVSIFDTKQNQDFKELIQKHHLKLDPCDKFHIEWTKFDKDFTEADFSECIKTADSFLITCVHIPFGRIAKIGVYIGAGFSFQQGFFVANISQENFLFVCLNDGEVHKLDIEFEMKMVPSVNPFGFDIKDLKTNKVVLTCEKSSNIFVCNSLLRRANQEYAKVGLNGDTQFSRDCVNFWMGNTSIDLHKNRNSDCIYGSNHIATNLRNSFQLLRPDNNIFFVPKDLTLKEFFEKSIPKTEEILDALLVYHEQHIITLETKFVDLKPSSESQSLFQIQDLRLNSLDHLKQLRNFELISPVQVYKSIISQHYSKLRTPILSHLVTEGEPLAVLKKIAPAGELSKEFMTAYQAILEKIGPYGHILGPIMGKDITLILFEIMLFVRCEEKNFTPRILQKTILQYIQNAQLQACDPNQLYAFLESAIDDVLHKNAVPEKNNLRFVNKYRQVLQQLRESDLIQDNYLVGSLLSTLFKGESAFYSKSQIIQNNLSKPLQYCSEIEELLTEGFDIIIPYCTYQVCNRNFTRLAQSVTTFMKLKAYPAALSKSRFFLETLSDLIMQFRKQNGALEFEVFTDSTIEELMLKLIHFVFTTLSQVLQAKQYLSSEIDLPEVLRQTLSVFNLLQDHLKLAHERKNILPSQAEMLVETVESAMTILQMLALEKAVIVRGLEEMYKFWQQYLSKMETVYTPQTIVEVLSLLDSISDDSLFFQILAPILELLEVWSKNSVLVTIFETIVQNPKLDDSVKTLTFFEYIMTFSKKLESANQIAQLIAKNSEIDKEELKANKKAVIVRVCTLFKSIQENLSNK